jgi:hypothetical protein
MRVGRIGRAHRGRATDEKRPGGYARARVQDLERMLVQAVNRARALDYELSHRRVIDLSAALAGDLRAIREQARMFDRELDLGEHAARELIRELIRPRALVLYADGGFPRPGAQALAAELTADLGRFRDLAQEYVEARELAHVRLRRFTVDPVVVARPAPATSWMAAGLVAHAVRALPAASRARWREEFDGELRELAEAAVGRRAQVRHAARVAVRAWTLRRALRPAQ